jgi:hypothetical protein
MSVALKDRSAVSSSAAVSATPSLSRFLIAMVNGRLVPTIESDIKRYEATLNNPTTVWTRRERRRVERSYAYAKAQLAFIGRTMT